MDENTIHWLEGGDPTMTAAIKNAQATFPEFVHELEIEEHRIIPALEAAVVKAFFPHPQDPAKGEHMFVEGISIESNLIHGVLSSDSNYVPGLREGQKVSFPYSRISDWFLVIDGKGRGGHTLQAIASSMSQEEYAEAKEVSSVPMV